MRKPRVLANYGKLPLSFEANQGQTDEAVKFLSRGKGYTLFLTSTEAVLSLRKGSAEPEAEVPRLVNDPGGTGPRRAGAGVSPGGAGADLLRSADSADRPPSSVLRMKLVGANPEGRVTGIEELPGKSNYFIGNDPGKWRTGVPLYAKVQYEEVYPGIDLLYYGTNQRQLEYDFVVSPGADPGNILLGFEGADELRLDKEGNLLLAADGGEVALKAPVLYQEVEGEKNYIAGGYVVEQNNQVAFEIAAYDASKPLIIDPVLSYSTYLGGSDTDVALGIAVDAAGNAYVTGLTGSANFPTANALQAAFGGGFRDAFVAKLNAAGSVLDYSTYLGGSSFDEGLDIAVDAAGNAYVTGVTNSADFPTANALQGTLDGGSFDAFVAKLSDPSPFIQALIQDVIDLNLQQGISNSLDTKLAAVLQALDDVKQNNNVAAINVLEAFINAIEAQRDIHIPEADAIELIADAQAIIALLGG